MTSVQRSYPTRLRGPRGARAAVTTPRPRAVPRTVAQSVPRAVATPRVRASRQHVLSEAVVAGYIRDLSTRGRRVQGELTAEAGRLTPSMAA